MAVARVGLKSGFPPPSRAAISIALASLPKSLPRAASWRPLRCLMFAHLEWPDMRSSDHVEQDLVDTPVTGQLRMEGGGEDVALSNHDRMLIDAGEDLDIG